MAGNYPDPPSRRMAYDRDGSIIVYVDNNAGTATQQAQSVLNGLNDDDYSTIGITFPDTPYSGYFGIIFPELRSVDGVFFTTRYTSPGAMQWSPDTTSLIDGTWTTVMSSTPGTDSAYTPYNRTNIVSVALTGVHALRFAMGGGYNAGTPNFREFILYGTIPATQSPDRLVFWHPTTNTALLDAVMDFGNAARGTKDTKTFRIKNNSASMIATGVNVSMQYNPDVTPTMVGQFEFSADNVTWSNTLTIGILAPGDISNLIYFRRNTAAGAQLSLFSPRIIAGYTTFS